MAMEAKQLSQQPIIYNAYFKWLKVSVGKPERKMTLAEDDYMGQAWSYDLSDSMA